MDEFIRAIANNSFSFEIDLSGIGITDYDVNMIVAAIKDGLHVSTLLLSSNRIGDTGAIALAEAIESNASLVYINLGFNHIQDKGALRLAQAVVQSPRFNRLIMSNNCVSSQGLIDIRDVDLEQKIDIAQKNGSRSSHAYQINLSRKITNSNSPANRL